MYIGGSPTPEESMPKQSSAAKIFLFILAALAVLTALTCIMLGVTSQVKGDYAFWGTLGAVVVAAGLFRAAGLKIDFDL